jgi:hypothetical protein
MKFLAAYANERAVRGRDGARAGKANADRAPAQGTSQHPRLGSLGNEGLGRLSQGLAPKIMVPLPLTARS